MSRSQGRAVRSCGLLLLFLTWLPVPARADNCGSLSDCYGTILAAVIVALALAILLFFLWEALAGAAAADAAGAGFAEGALSAGRMGRIIGWGTGQTAEAVAQTEAVTQSLTTQGVEAMIENGLTREFVAEQLAQYESALAQGARKLINKQLIPRLGLMRRILELWPP